MKRRTFDVLVSSVGLFLAAVLVVAGALLTWANTFVDHQVHNQLAAQKIYFPAKDNPGIQAPEFAAMKKYAGQELTTGAQAEVYADHYIANHLKEIGGGQTYAQLGPRGQGEGRWGKSEIDPARPFDVEDLSLALVRLKSGRTVLLETSWAGHQAEADYNHTRLFGTEAGLDFPPLRLHRAGRHGYASETVTALPPLVNPNRMVHFVDCLLGRAKPFVTTAESVAIQRILDAIYLSARLGREVRLKS